jgi:uncharacterized phage protein gp47/JayE
VYEDLTVEEIKSDILSRLKTDIDIREGSFINDMVSTVAYELWKSYQSLDAIIPIVYIDDTSGEYIDKKCAEYGIERKAGTKAVTVLYFTGADGITIPKGKVFLTHDGLEFVTDADVTIYAGTATVTATSAEIGDMYNAAAGTITRQYVNLRGLLTVTNTVAEGGSDPEIDSALVARLYDYLQKTPTSGNAYQYIQWAMEVPGVGDAKIFPLWDGPGTVKVVIVDNNKQPVAASQIEKVAEHIEAIRPIGAEVTIASGKMKQINLAAGIVLASGYSLQVVTNSVTEAVTEYFKSIAFALTYVSYAKLGTILLNTEGVIDYRDLKINLNNSNIPLAEDEIPVLGTVNLEV